MKGRPVPDRPAPPVARLPTGDIVLSNGTRLRYRGRVPGADFRSSGAWESADGLVVTAGVVDLAAGSLGDGGHLCLAHTLEPLGQEG